MKKGEAEQIIRYEATNWAREKGIQVGSEEMPSFFEFKDWLLNRHPTVMDFETRGGAAFVAQRWFSSELGQSWRD